MPFTLKKDSTEFQFDTDGSVVSGGAAAGSWSVNGDNQITLQPTSGAEVTFDVGWTFIDNQLCLTAGGEKVFNFHSAGFPDYSVVKNQIQVSPRVPASPFAFLLNGALSLNDEMDLVVKIGGVETKIVGTLEDTQGQFIYRFTDRLLGRNDALIFTGEWQRNDKVEGDVLLNFVYSVDGESRTIAIPRAFDVNPFTNALRLRYDKDGKSRLLELAGEIRFKNNSTLVFSAKKSGANGLSNIEVNFRLSGTGKTIKSLEVTVLKSSGDDGSKTLEIGGSLSAAVGKNGLTLSFRYAQKSGGAASKSVSLAVDGKFAMKNGTLVFSYKKDGSSATLSVEVQDFQFGDVKVGGGITVTQSGAQRTVRGFIGVQW